MTEQDTEFLPQLVDMVCQRLRAVGATDIQTDLSEKLIRFEHESGRMEMNLTTLLAYCLQESPSARPGLVDRYIRSFTEHTELQKASREAVLSKLMPIIRSDAHQFIMFKATGEDTPLTPSALDKLPSKPLGAGMRVYLAIDSESAMAMVTDKHLQEWGTTLDAALDAAMHELREKSTQGIWYECGPGLFKSKWNDGYDSSRLLLPEMLSLLPIKNPVFMAPTAHTLLVTAGDNPQALALMAKEALSDIATITRVLTLNLLSWKDGKLQAISQPEPVKRVLQATISKHNAWRYEMQHDPLVAELALKKEDVFVASLKLFTTPEGAAFGIAVWGANIVTLLPVSDMVALVSPDKSSPGGMRMHGFVKWEELHRKLGHLLERTTDEPPRFRTLRFPTHEELQTVDFKDMSKP